MLVLEYYDYGWLPLPGQISPGRFCVNDGAAKGQKPRKGEGGKETQASEIVGSPGQTRTADRVVNSHLLYQLSYRGTEDAILRPQADQVK